MYKTFLFNPTLKCNLACDYCYQTPNSESWDYFKTFDRLIEEIQKYDEPSKIIIHGGEPTLIGANNLEKLCEKAKNAKIKLESLRIQTNLYNWNDKFTKIAKEYDLRVSTSYDGPVSLRKDKKGRDTSSIIKSKIYELLTASVDVFYITDLLPICPVEDVIDDLCEIGIKYIAVRFPNTQLFSIEKMTQHVLDFYRKGIKKLTVNKIVERNMSNLISFLFLRPEQRRGIACSYIPCMETKLYLSVLGNGDIYPCNRRIKPELKLGNIQENTFIDVLSSTTTECLIKKERELWISEPCNSCPIKEFCFGGCHGERTNDKYIACDLRFGIFNLIKLFTQFSPQIIEFYIRSMSNGRSNSF